MQNVCDNEIFYNTKYLQIVNCMFMQNICKSINVCQYKIFVIIKYLLMQNVYDNEIFYNTKYLQIVKCLLMQKYLLIKKCMSIQNVCNH